MKKLFAYSNVASLQERYMMTTYNANKMKNIHLQMHDSETRIPYLYTFTQSNALNLLIQLRITVYIHNN